MKQELTEKQKLILEYIARFIGNKGYAPSVREIANRFGYSSPTAAKKHIDSLVKKGYLKTVGNISRGISLTEDIELEAEEIEIVNPGITVPVVGRVAAGLPILAEENLEGSIIIDSVFVRTTDDCYALKVKGDSMINAGIYEGDIVVVSPKKAVHNYDIIVAMVDGEATVKRFLRRDGNIQLLPENDAYPVIKVENSSDFSIAGKVVGVLRWYN
ncbi:MAG: transcriptional repressor LexA [Ignavibacteriales bacterium]|nr:MAG: transcriptional repressor LexA [Ignavibacteriaceae bacterium]MBW7872161.1 transcriptional repressor LexA [Ignavibacteria bacterium]MCZ2142255.1 transcriptional repressor LexA [Ignavibacteriales bacterium]OQY78801.1 MAG: repressor LexA [Ignavibacteriales bacterium UTCHB3]MBV6445694.1 LexA repressor [Ignavibacteriaceae bacterium]